MVGRRTISDQDGNLILMVLMVFLVLSILGTAIISIASLENKMSHYAVKAQQAQQAADAGAEWAIEQLWLQGLPEIYTEQLAIDEFIEADINVTEREVSVIDPGHGLPGKNECRYRFTVQSDYHSAKKELEVEVVYSYSGTNPLQYDKAEIKSYQYK